MTWLICLLEFSPGPCSFALVLSMDCPGCKQKYFPLVSSLWHGDVLALPRCPEQQLKQLAPFLRAQYLQPQLVPDRHPQVWDRRAFLMPGSCEHASFSSPLC